MSATVVEFICLCVEEQNLRECIDSFREEPQYDQPIMSRSANHADKSLITSPQECKLNRN